MEEGLSLIIPTYNEEKIIESTINKTVKHLEKMKIPFELIITDDGSKDGTVNIVKKKQGDKRIRLIENKRNRGRGEAVSEAILISKKKIILFMDADLSTDLKHIEEAVGYINQGYALVTGSRWSRGSLAYRNRFRKFVSLIYNNFIRFIFNSKIHDHECGFKAFENCVARNLVKKIGIKKTKERGVAWDTEILIIAQKLGYKIKEFPVKWTEGEKSEIKLLKHGKTVFGYIINLWIGLYILGYY